MGIIGGGTGPEINVTPLIDVLLVLVIMFLINSLPTPEGSRSKHPAAANKRFTPAT